MRRFLRVLAAMLIALGLSVPPTTAFAQGRPTIDPSDPRLVPNPIWVFSFPHQLALPEREMAGWLWRGPDSKSDCCCSMDAFELEVSGSATGREAADGLA
jgi:hypothetical protein